MLSEDNKEKTLSRNRVLLEACDLTFGKITKIVEVLKEASPEELPSLVAAIDLDLGLHQAKIRDHIKEMYGR